METQDLIMNNMNLVRSRVYALNNRAFDEDMEQEGMLGLILAAKRYDVGKGIAFSSFAVSYIDGFIKTYIFLKRPLIKPIRHKRKYLKPPETIYLGLLYDEYKIVSIYKLSLIPTSDYDRIEFKIVIDAIRKNNRVIKNYKLRKTLNYLLAGYTKTEIARMLGASQSLISKHINILKTLLRRFYE